MRLRLYMSSFDLLKEVDPNMTYRNILELYDIPWDPLTELIQNSVKSCQDRLANDAAYTQGSIIIKINSEKKMFEIIDDGVGFQTLKSLAANNSTRSDFGGQNSVEESGFGMGLTSVLARSDWFSVRSVNTAGLEMGMVFEKVREAIIRKRKSIKPKSRFGPSKARASNPKTRIVVKGNTGFNNLWKKITQWNNRGLDLREMMRTCLMWHSALGHTDQIWGRTLPNIRYRIEITGPTGNLQRTTWRQIGRPDIKLPGDRNVFDYSDYSNNGDLPQRNDLVVYRRSGRRVQRGRLGRVRIDTYLASTIKDADGTGGQSAIEKLIHTFPHFSTEEYSQDRIFICVNGYPQAFIHSQPQDRTNRAIWRNMICIINVDVNCVDPGRNKIKDAFMREIDKAILDIAKDVDNLIKNLQDPVHPLNLTQIVSDAEAHHRNNPFPFSFIQFPVAALPNLPKDENYVIGLFYACIMGGGVQEIQIIKQGSSHDAYDIVFQNQVMCRDISSSNRRRLSRNQARYNNVRLNKTSIGEFKTSANDLIVDLNQAKSRKDAEHIEYLICWDLGHINDPDWIISTHAPPDRIVRSSNYLLRKRSSNRVRIEVLALREWIEAWETAHGIQAGFPY